MLDSGIERTSDMELPILGGFAKFELAWFKDLLTAARASADRLVCGELEANSVLTLTMISL
jgi:hypothetical protein